MRDMAAEHGADAILIWVNTPLNTAKKRAVHPAQIRNGYNYHMTSAEFDNIVAKLEKPEKYEKAIKIDASTIDESAICNLLNI
jgi:gluconate kinase